MGDSDWVQTLHQRLDAAEATFLLGDFAASFRQADSLLWEYILLTTGPQTLDVDVRPCMPNCICEAGIALCLQALYEQGQVATVDKFLLKYYSSLSKMPLSTFALWAKLHSSVGNYEHVTSVCTQMIQTVQYRLTQEQYEGLVEVLVFYGLLPRHHYAETLSFIRLNKKLSIPIRKSLLEEVERLQRLHLSCPLSERAFAATDAAGKASTTSVSALLDQSNPPLTASSSSTSASTNPQQLQPQASADLSSLSSSTFPSSSPSSSSPAATSASGRNTSFASSPTSKASSTSTSSSPPSSSSWLDSRWRALESHPHPLISSVSQHIRRVALTLASSRAAMTLWRLRFFVFWLALVALARKPIMTLLAAVARLPVIGTVWREAGRIAYILFASEMGSRY